MSTSLAIERIKPRTTPVPLLEMLVVGVALVFFSGGFSQNGFISLPITLVRLSVVALALFLMRYHVTAFLRTALSDLPILLLTLVGLLSVLWSRAPGITLDQGIWLVMSTLVGVYIASAYNMREQLRLVLITLSMITLSSFVFSLVFPQYGIMRFGDLAGRWRGILTHKNVFSFFVSLTAILMLYFGSVIGRIRWVVLPLSSVMLVLSGGATGLIAFLAHVVLVPIMRFLRANVLLLTGILLISVPVVLALSGTLIIWYEDILAIFGRDGSLTGRTDLWDISFGLIADRPLLGYGIRAAFVEGTEARRALTWMAGFAHNGWIDITLDMGIVGLVLMVFSYARNLVRSIRYARNTSDVTGLYPLTYFTFIFIILYSASSLLAMNNLLWIMYVAITLSLANVHSEQQRVQREQVLESYRRRNERLRHLQSAPT